MAYSVISKKKGIVYYLHAQTTETPGGQRKIHFFCKDLRDGALDALPEGYEVTESETTGLPLLRRKS